MRVIQLVSNVIVSYVMVCIIKHGKDGREHL